MSVDTRSYKSNESPAYHDLRGAATAGLGRQFVPSREQVRQRKSIKINDCCVLLKNERKNMINPKKVEKENNFPECVDAHGQRAWGVLMGTWREAPGVCRLGLCRPWH